MSNKKYAKCPLSRWAGGRCVFASIYYGVTRCFYACNETIIVEKDIDTGEVLRQPNIECPKQRMYREGVKRRLEAERMQESMSLLEGDKDTRFA